MDFERLLLWVCRVLSPMMSRVNLGARYATTTDFTPTTCRGFVGSHEPVGEESEGFASRGLLQDEEMGKLAVRGHVDCELSHVSLERVRGLRDTWYHTVHSCCYVVTTVRCSLLIISFWGRPEDVPGQPPSARAVYCTLIHVCFFRAWDMPRLADSQEPHIYRGTRSFHRARMGITLDVIRPRRDEEWSIAGSTCTPPGVQARRQDARYHHQEVFSTFHHCD